MSDKADNFVFFEVCESDDVENAGCLMATFRFEKLVIGNGSIEYTSYCLDEYGEPIMDKNDFVGVGKNCTLSEYEQIFKNKYKGINLNKVDEGLYQLLTKQWKRYGL